MEDVDILRHIGDLANEERALEESHVGKGLSEDETSRLHAIEVALDQCWDLLRQRRARREFGQDPNAAKERPESVVEHYRQ
jgi:hypothetical protein